MLLKTINYDSVTNFIELYDQYKKNNHLSFEDFFRKYIPTLNKNANNCVGLALLLIEKLKQFDDRYSGIKNCFYLVSCEINLQSFDKYENTEYPCPWLSVNEHIMVALKIEIDGRVGVLLLDPGYPLDRVITVMNDQEYPNTGHFLSSTNPEEVYLIEMIMQGKYLQWSIYDESNLKETNLIYIGAPYLSPISVTERRNLVFTYRFFFSLSEKGENLSGIFAKIDEHILCLYYIDEDYPKEKQIIKLTPELFSSVNQLNSDIKKTLDRISHHLKISSKELWNILTKLNHIIEDEQFLDSLCKINNDIQNLNSGK
ncbi:uncharacterized protein LOC126907539 [Daktulosphaira vitifoliae]|uniref:uncharacterized protein LOC126907539 n=1 Tax=Daktulosphaira vitifoliae TaxID=58002 RepID=UPI0021AA1A6A|nr:uncharacterized protein LOC126907539 [Daktulosphaira vitifoliae]